MQSGPGEAYGDDAADYGDDDHRTPNSRASVTTAHWC